MTDRAGMLAELESLRVKAKDFEHEISKLSTSIEELESRLIAKENYLAMYQKDLLTVRQQIEALQNQLREGV